jgi:hypothetical protein
MAAAVIVSSTYTAMNASRPQGGQVLWLQEWQQCQGTHPTGMAEPQPGTCMYVLQRGNPAAATTTIPGTTTGPRRQPVCSKCVQASNSTPGSTRVCPG